MEWLAALKSIGHVLYRERQMRETFGFTVFEAELTIPILQPNVLADDANADGLNRSRPGVFEDVLDEASTDSAVAMRWKYG
jgi:hypothetical protein